MSLSPEEAARALDEVGAAGEQMRRLTNYSYTAPYFMIWGVVWLVTNGVTQFAPQWAGYGWLGGIAGGTVANIVVDKLAARRREPTPMGRLSRGQQGLRFGLIWFGIMAFMAASALVLWPLDFRRVDALVSLFIAFGFMLAGVWMGWRLSLIGAVTTALIVGGFLFAGEWFFLWMGVVSGGSLFAGGLWLRRA